MKLGPVGWLSGGDSNKVRVVKTTTETEERLCHLGNDGYRYYVIDTFVVNL